MREGERRGRGRRRPGYDFDAMYRGFGGYDEPDDYDDEEEEEDEEDRRYRGCSRFNSRTDGRECIMSQMGRYFEASDYDEFYED